MNKIILSIIAAVFATSAIAFTVNPTPVPPKKTPEVKAVPTKPSTKVWLPPLEIQNKVAPVKK